MSKYPPRKKIDSKERFSHTDGAKMSLTRIWYQVTTDRTPQRADTHLMLTWIRNNWSWLRHRAAYLGCGSESIYACVYIYIFSICVCWYVCMYIFSFFLLVCTLKGLVVSNIFQMTTYSSVDHTIFLSELWFLVIKAFKQHYISYLISFQAFQTQKTHALQ